MFQKNKLKIQALNEKLENTNALVNAIEHSLAKIEFDPSGIILSANSHFLNVVGYQEKDIVGKHHQLFCPREVYSHKNYKLFWKNLASGNTHTGQFQRLKEDGTTIWLSATYFPVMNGGKVTKVVKIASDITSEKLRIAAQDAIFSALHKSLAVIEFTPLGIITTANQNFLSTLGYQLDEIKGKHHKIFCFDAFYIQNPEFWNQLASGRFLSGRFERKDINGGAIWIEATYNPIFDEHGEVVKVIKFASNITKQVERENIVIQVAEIAQSTSVETEQVASEGKVKLEETVKTTNDISSQVNVAMNIIRTLNEQSQNIANIVSTISSIAEQTNLLALNAAIEAARAGEQGRGFAVVADEVRSLAARTSSSTEEISNVVSQNQQLTGDATKTMEVVTEITQKGLSQVESVSSVMEEIKAGAENVSRTVSDLTLHNTE